MKDTIRLQVKKSHSKKFQSKYPLVTEDAIQNIQDLKIEGSIIELYDDRQFLGKGYYGKQNKGRGWILTHNPKEQLDRLFFEGKIKKALEHRKSLIADPQTTAFRMFNGEGDGVGGFTIDVFEDYYVINWYSEGIYQFKDEIIQSLTNLIHVKGLYEKKRFAEKGMYVEDDDFILGEKAPEPLIVKENGMNFAVYLNDGAMVGIFLDQRDVRRKIRDAYSKDKTVLNTFSYTGAFSVAAALGGAKKTTSVDLANRSKSKTIEQFSLNKIDVESQDIIVEDVFQYFKYAVRKELSFDVVILDPPSFARSKKHTFSAEKDYTDLLSQAIQITNKDGIIVASTNSSKFGMTKFKGFIDKAFKNTGSKYKIREEFSLPTDFKTIPTYPEGNYLKVVFLQKI